MTENQKLIQRSKKCDLVFFVFFFTVQNGITQKEETEKRGTGGGRQFTKGQRRSTNSLESLYSLNSGQSSSSKHLQAEGQVFTLQLDELCSPACAP